MAVGVTEAYNAAPAVEGTKANGYVTEPVAKDPREFNVFVDVSEGYGLVTVTVNALNYADNVEVAIQKYVTVAAVNTNYSAESFVTEGVEAGAFQAVPGYHIAPDVPGVNELHADGWGITASYVAD